MRYLGRWLCLCFAVLINSAFCRAQSQEVVNIGVNQGLTQGYVSGIAQDSYGFLWISTLGGLNRWDGSQMLRFRHSSFDSTSLSNNNIHRLLCDSRDDLWMILENGGIELFSKKASRFFRLNDLLPLHGQKCLGIVELEFMHYAVITHEEILCFSLSYRTDGAPSILRPSIELIAPPRTHGFGECTHICSSGPSHIVIANDSSLYICNTRFEVLTSHRLATTLAQGQALYPLHNNQNHYAVTIDTEGKTNVFPISENPFEQAKAIAISLPKPTSLNPISLFLDVQNKWWVGTGGSGLYCEASNNHHLVPKQHPNPTFRSVYGCEKVDEHSLVYFTEGTFVEYDLSQDRFTESNGFSWKNARGTEMRKDANGRYWIVNSAGIEVFDQKQQLVQRVFQSSPNEPRAFALQMNGNQASFVSALGLYILDANSMRVKEKFPFQKGLIIEQGITFHQILEHDGHLFVATSRGILKYERSTGLWSHVSLQGQSFHEEVFVILADRLQRNCFWIGTAGNGLLHYNASTEKIQTFSANDGLSGDIIYGLLYSNDGHLWMSTNNGITRMHTVENTFETFTTDPHFYSSEFNRYSYFSPDGENLYFGGVSGVVHITASSFHTHSYTPKLSIENIETSQGAQLIYSLPSLSYNDVVTIEANEKNSFIHLQFIAPNLHSTGPTFYRYRITGMNEQWSTPSTKGELIFPTLSAGTYELHLSVSAGNGTWYEYPQPIVLSIAPVWYRTLWFYAIIVSAIALALYLVYRVRLHQINEKQAIKDALARDLHDEIGSSLSSIAIYTEVAMQHKTQSEKLDTVLQRILKTSIQTQEMMSGIIRSLKYQDVPLSQFAIQLRDLSSNLVEGTGVELKLEVFTQTNYTVHALENKHLVLMVKEAVNNALKYAKASIIILKIAETKQAIHIYIIDNGCGMDTSKATHGNGLKNLRERARFINAQLNIDSQLGRGTEIHITLKR